MKEGHVADLKFGDQLLNFTLKGLEAVGVENSLPIGIYQGPPLRGVERGGEDSLRHNLLNVGEDFRALFQGNWDHIHKLIGDDPSPTRTNGAQKIGARFPIFSR